MKPADTCQNETNLLIINKFPIRDYNQRLISEWETWAENAQPGQGEQRDLALNRLKDALLTNSRELNLAQLALTTLPDRLPPVLICDISKNLLTALPDSLPNSIQVLKADYNQLVSLPNNLPGSLSFLNASNNQLSSLPQQLPDSIKILVAIKNQLTELPDTLPPSIRILKVDHNQLASLSNRLPHFLNLLSASNNQLSSLPPQLPASLKFLFVYKNQLISLPTNLPDSITILKVDFNQLVSLPTTLPSSLKYLTANHNQLIFLPDQLPNAMTRLELNDNLLYSLTNTLPPCLTQLFVHQNYLSSLPATLPDSIQILNAGNNALTQLPDRFPGDLRYLNLSTNNIMLLPLFLERLTSVYPRANIQLANQNGGELIDITLTNKTFIEKLQLWDTNLKFENWKGIHNEQNADFFADFIEKLHQGSNADNLSLKSKLLELLNYLSKEENKDIRKQVFLLSHEASESCVDKASYFFNQMHLLMVEDNLTKTEDSQQIAELFYTVQRIYRMRVLDRIAAEHAKRLRKAESSFNEDVALHLAYQHNLRDELSLPIHTALQFNNIVALTESELISAKDHLLYEEKNHFLRYLVTESRSWGKKIESWSSERKQQVTDSYSDTIASDAFQERITKELHDRGIEFDDVDARREIGSTLANDLLYEKFFELTHAFLQAHNALSLLDHFPNLPRQLTNKKN